MVRASNWGNFSFFIRSVKVQNTGSLLKTYFVLQERCFPVRHVPSCIHARCIWTSIVNPVEEDGEPPWMQAGR